MAQIAEQRTARKWRIGFRFLWLALAGVVFWFSLHHNKAATSANPSSHTALIEIQGEIDSEANANADAIMTSLRSAFEDEGAEAIVLLINSQVAARYKRA